MKPDADFGVDERDVGGGLKFGKAGAPVLGHPDRRLPRAYRRRSLRRYRQTLGGIDALLMLSRSNFRPFVLFGVGVERDKVENPLRNVSKNSGYATVGLGFQASLTPQLSLQADMRSVRGFLRDDDLYGFKQSNNKYVTVGLNYAFNPPPVAAGASDGTGTSGRSPDRHQHRHRSLHRRHASKRSPCRPPNCSRSTRPN